MISGGDRENSPTGEVSATKCSNLSMPWIIDKCRIKNDGKHRFIQISLTFTISVKDQDAR